MGQKNRPPTFDHLRKKQPMERVVRVPLDDEAVVAFQEAQLAVGRAEMAKADLTDVTAALVTARAALDASTIAMKFRSIGRKRYDALVLAHPPTADQKAETPAAPYDIDSFPQALIASSCVEPEMTVEQVEELSETWNVSEFLQLWMAALEVNTQRRVVDLGKGSSGTRG